MKPWYLTSQLTLSLSDRVRLLFGVPLFVRFISPDGECHAACAIAGVVRPDSPGDDWPADLVRWQHHPFTPTVRPRWIAPADESDPAPRPINTSCEVCGGQTQFVGIAGHVLFAHSLTLAFDRLLSETEWRDVVDRARQLPYVQHLHARAVEMSSPSVDDKVRDIQTRCATSNTKSEDDGDLPWDGPF